MGQQNSASNSRHASMESLREGGLDKDVVVDLHCFTLQETIGKGAFGKVKKVKLRHTKQLYALKYMDKKGAIDANSVKNIFEERRLLETLEHPFIVNLRFAFQDYYNMFFVLDLALGGDLRWQINTAMDIPMQTIQLYAAQLYLALEYLHEQKIIHRDIKPDNLLLDEQGYLKICDFNVSFRVEDRLPKRKSGTLCYMAPEMLTGDRYDYLVDFWMVGITLYEVVYKRRPFTSKISDEDLMGAISSGQFTFPDFKLYHEKKLKLSKDVYTPTPEFKSFIQGLLQIDRKQRLGHRQNPIPSHPFLADVNLPKVLRQEVTPLYAPDASQANFNFEHQIGEFMGNEKQLSHTRKTKKRSESSQSLVSLQDKPFNIADLPKGAAEQLEFIEFYFKPYRQDTKTGMLTERPNYIGDTNEKSPNGSVLLNNSPGSPASVRVASLSKGMNGSSSLARSMSFGSRRCLEGQTPPKSISNLRKLTTTKSMSGLAQVQ